MRVGVTTVEPGVRRVREMREGGLALVKGILYQSDLIKLGAKFCLWPVGDKLRAEIRRRCQTKKSAKAGRVVGGLSKQRRPLSMPRTSEARQVMWRLTSKVAGKAESVRDLAGKSPVAGQMVKLDVHSYDPRTKLFPHWQRKRRGCGL